MTISTPQYRMFGTYRFALATLVLLQHFTNIAPREFMLFWHPLGTGSLAVLVFFVLSGFIIIEAVENSYQTRPWAFLLNRALRIIPSFLAALALSVLVHIFLHQSVGVRLVDAASTGLMPESALSLGNIFYNVIAILPGVKGEGHYEFISVTWALRAELLFYVVVAGALLLGRRWFGRHVTLFGVALLGLAGFALQRFGRGPELLSLIPYFILGGALFYAMRGSLVAMALMAISYACCMLQFQNSNQAAWDALAGVIAPRDFPTQLILLTSLIALMPVFALMQGGWFRKIDQKLGDLTYTLYLNHIIIVVIVRALMSRFTPLTLMLAIMAALALSYAMHALVEPHLVRLRDIIRGRSIEKKAAKNHNSDDAVEQGVEGALKSL